MGERAETHIGLRVLGWTMGLFWLALFFGLVDLSVPLVMHDRPEFYANYLLSTGWGVLFTFFVGLPLCFLGVRSDWICAALINAVAGIAVLIAAIASGQPAQLIIVVGLLVPLVAVWNSARFSDHPGIALRRLLGERVRFVARLPLLVLALIAVPPAVVYAAQMIEAARTGVPEPEITWDLEHAPVQAAFALAIPLAAAALALMLAGWRPMAWLIAAGTAWFGVVSIVFPDHFGSWGSFWGWMGVAWSVALALVALVPRRLSRPARPARR
ncbi:hypothetical protein [Agromyces sp. NPDC057865]|uniref:hypothetical protein n=1 Tax=Agromyces sp. NPDC057865 TaxID=3346267 RepID=UPI00366F23DF